MHKHSITSEEHKSQRSYRHVILEAMEGSFGGKARVVYVDVRKSDQNEEKNLLEYVAKLRMEFNSCIGDEKPFYIAVVGDEPIFKKLFQLWLDSYLNQTQLCNWMIPIPGGFHIDKQGIIPLIKSYLSGIGIEELARFSGLSSKHQREVVGLKHYRKNRRFLSQVTAASILRLCDVLCSENAKLAGNVEQLLLDIRGSGTAENAQRSEEFWRRRREDQRRELPNQCELALSRDVHPGIIRIGRLICEDVRRVAGQRPGGSKNMQILAEEGILNMLVPWMGYNILTRAGQTHIVDEFWFVFCGVLHKSNKLRYQDNLLWYVFIKDRMPEAVRRALYTSGNFVMSSSDTCMHVNSHLDEGNESGIIRDVKINVKTCDATFIQNAPSWIQRVAQANDILEIQLLPSRRSSSMQMDVSSRTDSSRFALKDREKRTATNVAYMYEFLTEREWLGSRHVGEKHVVNYLSDTNFPVKDIIADAHLNARMDGIQLSKLHLCAILTEQFGTLSKEEELFVFGKYKPARQKWTIRHSLPSIISLSTENQRAKSRSNSRRVSKNAALRNMNRRNRQIINTRELLQRVKDDEDTSARRRQEATELLEEFNRTAHIRTSRAFCFRRNVSSNHPYWEKRPRFLLHVQTKLREMGIVGQGESFVSRKPLLSLAPFRVIHMDVTQRALFAPTFSAENMTLEGCLRHKARTNIAHNISTIDLSNILEFHVHIDIPELIPGPKSIFNREAIRSFVGDERVSSIPDADGESTSKRLDLSSPLTQTWTSIVSKRDEREYVTMVFALFTAISVVDILGESLRAGEGEGRRMPKVYLHGVSLAVSNNCVGMPLSELRFGRQGSCILVTSHAEYIKSFPSTRGAINSVGGFVCWEVSLKGLSRAAAADSNHAQMRTRINFVTWRLSIPVFERLRIPAPERKVLVISSEDAQDTPLISFLSQDIRVMLRAGGCIVHQVGPLVFECGRIQTALESSNTTVEDLVLLFGVSGCDEIPFSRHILQKTFVEAFFSCRNIFGQLFSSEMMRNFTGTNVGSDACGQWKPVEKLFAAAWVLHHQTERRRQLLEPRQSQEVNWVHMVREWITSLENLNCPSHFLPESVDIELQARRAYWLLGYWKLADTAD